MGLGVWAFVTFVVTMLLMRSYGQGRYPLHIFLWRKMKKVHLDRFRKGVVFERRLQDVTQSMDTGKPMGAWKNVSNQLIPVVIDEKTTARLPVVYTPKNNMDTIYVLGDGWDNWSLATAEDKDAWSARLEQVLKNALSVTPDRLYITFFSMKRPADESVGTDYLQRKMTSEHIGAADESVKYSDDDHDSPNPVVSRQASTTWAARNLYAAHSISYDHSPKVVSGIAIRGPRPAEWQKAIKQNGAITREQRDKSPVFRAANILYQGLKGINVANVRLATVLEANEILRLAFTTKPQGFYDQLRRDRQDLKSGKIASSLEARTIKAGPWVSPIVMHGDYFVAGKSFLRVYVHEGYDDDLMPPHFMQWQYRLPYWMTTASFCVTRDAKATSNQERSKMEWMAKIRKDFSVRKHSIDADAEEFTATKTSAYYELRTSGKALQWVHMTVLAADSLAELNQISDEYEAKSTNHLVDVVRFDGGDETVIANLMSVGVLP